MLEHRQPDRTLNASTWDRCHRLWLLGCTTILLLAPTVDSLGHELVTGEEIELQGGSLHVSFDPAHASSSPDLLIHFHGALSVTTENFARARIEGVLVTINYKGLSSAYSRPFRESPRLFQQVLDLALQELRQRGKVGPGTNWRRVCVSSFSAGYGAVREILKTPEYFRRIDGVLAADSIYAGLQQGVAERRVNELHMRDFRRFAQLAGQRKKTFVITHSQLETPYASTAETANDLLAFVGIARATPPRKGQAPLLLHSRAAKGNLTVLEYEGDTGQAHLEHLRNIGTWWQLLPFQHLDGDLRDPPDEPVNAH